MLFGLKGPRTLMVTPGIDPKMREAAHGLVGSDGQPVIVINDSPGFVAQRAVAMLVNVGCNIAQRGIGVPADIDKGAKLGLGYPFGPIEWGDRIGPRRVLFILERLQAFYQEPRYRPSPWLKRRVMLGLPLSAPESSAADSHRTYCAPYSSFETHLSSIGPTAALPSSARPATSPASAASPSPPSRTPATRAASISSIRSTRSCTA